MAVQDGLVEMRGDKEACMQNEGSMPSLGWAALVQQRWPRNSGTLLEARAALAGTTAMLHSTPTWVCT